MCGLVGMFGIVTPAMEKAFNDLLIVDVVRGAHSTGVVSVKRGQKQAPVLLKQVGTPDNLFDMKDYQSRVLSGVQRVLIGHNRFATKGAVNKRNAHPFQFDNIVGAHNGSLTSYNQLDGYGEYNVDSQVLFNHIQKHGMKDAWDKTVGAMALTYWDDNTNTMNIVRNDERSLFFAYTENDDVLIYASEPWMLEMVAYRHNIKIKEINLFKTNTLMSWELDLHGKIINFQTEDLGEKKKIITMGTTGGQQTTTATAPVGTNQAKFEHYEVGFRGLNHSGVGFYELHPVTASDTTAYIVYAWNNKLETGDIVKAQVSYHALLDNIHTNVMNSMSLEIIRPVFKDDDEEELYLTPDGEMDRTLFLQKYHTCAWCSEKVEPQKGFYFYHDEVLCDCCMEYGEQMAAHDKENKPVTSH